MGSALSKALTEEMFHFKAKVLKENGKVLYAEVDDKLADVLLSFLALPIGTVVRLILNYYEAQEPPSIGSLNSFYTSLKTMDSRYFKAETGKMMLLHPRNSFAYEYSQLKIKIDDTPPPVVYFCEKGKCTTMYFDSITCRCGLLMNKEVSVEDFYRQQGLFYKGKTLFGDGGTFAREAATFLLSDDLKLLPNDPEHYLQILREYNVVDTDMLEEMSVSWGFHQIITLLEGSLLSKSPLSNTIFRSPWIMRKDVSYAAKQEPHRLKSLSILLKSLSIFVIVKAFVEKFTKRILFIQCEEDFLEFLFGFLVLPLGAAHRLCGGDCDFGSIGNLYHSTVQMDMVTCFTKAALTLCDLKVPYAYKTAAMDGFRVMETDAHYKLAYRYSWWPYLAYRPYLNFIDPKGGDTFLKEDYKFTAMEDLEVSVTATSSISSALNLLKIPLSDIEEQQLELGCEEVICLLKAAFTSKCAITDGLKQFLK